jgi:hypothetical protein
MLLNWKSYFGRLPNPVDNQDPEDITRYIDELATKRCFVDLQDRVLAIPRRGITVRMPETDRAQDRLRKCDSLPHREGMLPDLLLHARLRLR